MFIKAAFYHVQKAPQVKWILEDHVIHGVTCVSVYLRVYVRVSVCV